MIFGDSLKNQRVLITGASSGLGLILARRFLRAGARVTICSRSSEHLKLASEWLKERTGFAPRTEVCDVGNRDQVRKMVARMVAEERRIDILVNNASIIQVGPAQDWTLEDFDEAMSSNFNGTLNCTYAVLPYMRRRQRGKIVNITSIGAEVAVPHLLPYICSKFAALGLSLGSAAEFARDGIKVITVVPGLMRTGSFVNVDFRSKPRREYRWFRAGATLPLVSKSAEPSAAAIIRAVRSGRSYLVIGTQAKLARVAARLLPRMITGILAAANRLILPAPSQGGPRSMRGNAFESPQGLPRTVGKYQPQERTG